MKQIVPNYRDLAFADIMKIRLKSLVENHLSLDLVNYGITEINLKFNWSECCIEGHRTSYLDGEVENFSGISVFSLHDNLVAHGWMEFIHDIKTDYFIAYWEFIKTYNEGRLLFNKKDSGLPEHIFNRLPESIKENYRLKLVVPLKKR